jgi:hypothetical protein
MIPVEVYEQTIRDFLKPVKRFLDDPAVTEVMINGPDEVYIERGGKLTRTDARFTPDELLSALRNIAQFQGVPIGGVHQILEARLPDGSRVEAILPPAGSGGPHVAIRRFSKDKLTISKLLELGALTPDAAETLRVLVECKQNVIVAGGELLVGLHLAGRARGRDRGQPRVAAARRARGPPRGTETRSPRARRDRRARLVQGHAAHATGPDRGR